jgi:outer membrane protein insertion porin family
MVALGRFQKEPGRMKMAVFVSAFFVLSGAEALASASIPQIDSVQPQTGCPVSERIVSVDIRLSGRGKKNYFMRLAGDVISLKEGGCFSQAGLSESLLALGLVKKFRDIESLILDSPDGKKITFRLKQAGLVRDIKIKGEYPLFESDVRQVLTIYPGDAYSDSVLSEQDSLVRGLLRNRGFPKADIRVHSETVA